MSFRLKTIVGVGLIEIIMLVVLIYSSLQSLRESNEKLLAERAQSTVVAFATTVKDAVIASDLATLEEFVASLSTHNGITYVKVLNDEAKVLAQSGSARALAHPFHTDNVKTFEDDDGSFDVAADIREGGTYFGRVELGVSTGYLDEVIEAARVRFAIIAGIEVVLTALFSLMLGTYLTHQLTLLNHGARRLAEGNFGDAVPVIGRDEIAETAVAFNEMSRRLQATYHEIRRGEARLQAVFDSVVDGIVTINEHGIVQTVNPAVERIFGYAPDELVGQNVAILTPSPHREQHDEYIARYIRTGEARVIGHPREVEGVRKDGALVPIELIMNELEIDGERAFLGLTRDISERKQIEQMKDGFVATISHELRTPLTVILGYLPFLTDAGKMPAPAMVAQMAGKIETAGKHLLHLVNDLLDISKLEAGRMQLHLEAVDIAAAVDEAVGSLRELARGKGLALMVDSTPCLVTADPVRLQQVLINLIGNAVKFSEHGSILVATEIDPGRNEVAVAVSDSGPGIAEAEQAAVFDRFRQADNSATRRAGGTGLGLAITKSLVELHGGRITLHSTPGQGSTFTFTIPIASRGEGDSG